MSELKHSSFLGKALLASVFVSAIFGAASASAYTVTFNSTFGKFEGGATTNVVEYNDQHEVVSGEYKDIKTPRLIQFNYSSADFAA